MLFMSSLFSEEAFRSVNGYNTLKRILKKGLSLPLQLLRRHNAKSALTRLASHKNLKLRAIGVAVQETLAHNLSLQEQQAIFLIEERRSFLLNSDKEINVVDYGAGSPNSNRTKEEMEKGVQSTAQVSKITGASKPKFWAIMLFKIIRKLEPLSCVELGSCVGISASYQAAALNINGEGTIVTLEGSPEIANIAQETFENLGIKNASVVTGPFHETLGDVFEASSPIDFFFNDGHHDHDAVIRYFNQAVPYLSDGAVIVFDDISWSTGMRKAWTEIEGDERVSASIDLHTIGIALIDKTIDNKERFRIPL
jgi:predicted O-methyltransferase YrrM